MANQNITRLQVKRKEASRVQFNLNYTVGSLQIGKLSKSVYLAQDELTTTKRSYEDQLSMMSDHLCSMNETLSKQREEIDTLKLGGKVPRQDQGSYAACWKSPDVGFSIFQV